MITLRKIGTAIEHGVGWLIIGMTVIASATILFVAVVSSAGSIGRLTFHPIHGVIETSTLLMAIIVFFAIARAQVMDQHVRIQVFTRLMPERLREIVGIVALLISLTFFILLIWGTGKIAWGSLLIREVYFGDVKFPIWITKQVIPIGCFSMCLYLMIQITKAITQFKNR